MLNVSNLSYLSNNINDIKEPMVPYSNCIEYANSLVKVDNAKDMVILVLIFVIAVKIYLEYKERKKGRQAP